MPFSTLPALPTENVTQAELLMYASIKQNIEQLTGQSGDAFSVAVLRGSIRVQPISSLQAKPLSGIGNAYTINDVQVAPASELVKLATTVQQCINDISLITSTLNALILQLRS